MALPVLPMVNVAVVDGVAGLTLKLAVRAGGPSTDAQRDGVGTTVVRQGDRVQGVVRSTDRDARRRHVHQEVREAGCRHREAVRRRRASAPPTHGVRSQPECRKALPQQADILTAVVVDSGQNDTVPHVREGGEQTVFCSPSLT